MPELPAFQAGEPIRDKVSHDIGHVELVRADMGLQALSPKIYCQRFGRLSSPVQPSSELPLPQCARKPTVAGP
jgi:hypothetical protein